MNTAEECLPEALAAFDFGAPVAGAVRYGKGHINDTFCVKTQPEDEVGRRFILQRISPSAFARPDQVMANIIEVTDYLGKIIQAQGGDRKRESLEVLRTREGLPYFTDRREHAWRAYPFVEGTVCLECAKSPEQFAAAGRAFGNSSICFEIFLHRSFSRPFPDFMIPRTVL